jgi:hypothetical protein
MLIGAILFLLLLLLFFQLIFLPVINLHSKTIKLAQQPRAQSQEQDPAIDVYLWKTAFMKHLEEKVHNNELPYEELEVYEYFENLKYGYNDNSIGKEEIEEKAEKMLQAFILRRKAEIPKDKQKK